MTSLVVDPETAIVLDFGEVKSASSSFLDEILGRMAEDLGPEAFRQKIKVVGMSELIESMANVVISQRLSRLDTLAAGLQGRKP